MGGSYLQTFLLKGHESLLRPFSLPGERGAHSEVPPLACIRKKATAKCHYICIALFFFFQILCISGRKWLRGLDFDFEH